jgi:hypothetical protein
MARPPFGRKVPCHRELLLGDVDAGEGAAAPGEFAGQHAGAGGEIEDALSWQTDAERCQPGEEARRRTGPIAGVVGRGSAPVDIAPAIDGAIDPRLLAHRRQSRAGHCAAWVAS